jgi:hypothetical protein
MRARRQNRLLNRSERSTDRSSVSGERTGGVPLLGQWGLPLAQCPPL